ncbi:MAG: anion permease [Candidatus Synoicihabitans palmerolidicus]|nr:anion permease [Candidatus Synoicihabitans palmerolidicus]
MTGDIALIFVFLVLTFASFVWGKFPPDVTALALFIALIVTGLLPAAEALAVFSNPAPITVGAMFVLSAALVKCGLIDRISGWVNRAGSLPYPVVLLVMVAFVATLSAFVNNTPVVVVFLPVVLGLARKMKLAPSKLLIPLSYAAVLGGTCTLVGTSTNLIVNGIAISHGERSFSFFELAWLGVPTAILGGIYLAIVGKRVLPVREMFTDILSEEERREYIAEAFVQPNSALTGKTINESGLKKARGVRVLELVRHGIAIPLDPATTKLHAGDRMILSCRPHDIAHIRSVEGIDLFADLQLGLEQIAAQEGSLVEAVATPQSSLVGQTVRGVNFRQRFRMVAVALHRKGRNVRKAIETLPIEPGDVLLMMGTDQAIDRLRNSDDLVLFDRARTPAKSPAGKIALVIGVIAAVITAVTWNIAPLEITALTGCVVLLVAGVLKSKEAYAAVEWNLIFLIFGMLGMGVALEQTGGASWLASHLVDGVHGLASTEYRPLVALAAIYLTTMVLTELLSNNAIAALMAPIALRVASEMGMDPRPFIVGVTFAASAAFSTPIGYQTNTYIYGVGGYRFTDFLKIGLPMNALGFGMALTIIPIIWPFQESGAASVDPPAISFFTMTPIVVVSDDVTGAAKIAGIAHRHGYRTSLRTTSGPLSCNNVEVLVIDLDTRTKTEDAAVLLHRAFAPRFCPALLPRAFAPRFCPALLPRAFAPRFCPALLPRAFAPRFCLALLPRAFAPRFCPALLPRAFAPRIGAT